MMPPKTYTDDLGKKTAIMVALESEKPFAFPVSTDSEKNKAAWDVWAEKWNAECEKSGLLSLKVIASENAIV